MQRLAAECDNDEIRQKAMKNALSTQSRKRLEAMIFLAQSDLPVAPDRFDRDPFALNVLNGTLDVRNATLRPHDHHDFITKLAPVTYDPAARFPRWERFVREIMQDDDDMIDYLQRFFGLCLTGDVTEHLLAILYGGGANGKSTLLHTMRAILGDYAATIDAALLLAQRDSSGPKPELARLAGTRFVSANEMPEGGRLSESIVKVLTGGDVISARRLFSDIIEIAPTWKLAIATNSKPVIRDNSDGMWRRVRLIEFGAKFEGEQCDPNLAAILAAESSGVLNWALAGHRRWLREGLGRPKTIVSATSGYRADNDLLTAFIDDACVMLDRAETRSSQLYDAFTKWAAEGGEKYIATRRKFFNQVRERGIKERRSNGDLIFLGVGLRA